MNYLKSREQKNCEEADQELFYKENWLNGGDYNLMSNTCTTRCSYYFNKKINKLYNLDRSYDSKQEKSLDEFLYGD